MNIYKYNSAGKNDYISNLTMLFCLFKKIKVQLIALNKVPT